MSSKRMFLRVFILFSAALLISGTASARPLEAALGTSFTYQGRLTDGGAPANGSYDLNFKLFDALSGGTQVGSDFPVGAVTVTNGLFTVQLDFGNVFDGRVLYLEIAVRPAGGTTYTKLTPRQALSPTPYALYAVQAYGASRLEGQPGSYYRNAGNINAGMLGNSFFDAYANLGNAGYLGNAAGDLALNNGTLQATLNADQLDGKHAADFVLSTHNHWGQTWSGSGTGLTLSGGDTGLNGWGTNYGVYGTGSISGVYGLGTDLSGIGVIGEGAQGVYGQAIAAEDIAIHGVAFGGANYNWAGRFDGNVQINGILNVTGTTNINADMLDGNHSSAFSLSNHNHWGQTWSGSGSGLILSGGSVGLDGSGSAYGVLGTGNGVGSFGIFGTSTSGTGVYGNSNTGTGVYGNGSSSGVQGFGSGTGSIGVSGSGIRYGVYGNATGSGTTYGVYGNGGGSGTSYGVYGTSASTDGVYGISSSAAGVSGSGATYGVYGASSGGTGVYGTSVFGVVGSGTATGVLGTGNSVGVDGEGNNYGVYAQATKSGGYAIYGRAYGGSGNYAGYFDGNVQINGNQTVTGSKSALVKTRDYGSRTLYSVESPENWFEDFGTGQLTEGGTALITIEPIYAETVNLTEDYHVFLTPVCDTPVLLFVTQKTATGFSVRGVTLDNQPAQCGFDYRIVAKRLGYEGTRLAESTDTQPVADTPGK